MVHRSIFFYTQYKTYLRDREKGVKGFRSRVAVATRCQNAFVSQVLNGSVNFNLEQALMIADYLGLSGDEHQYFLWMVEWARAGTEALRKYFAKLMMELREKNLDLKERVKAQQTLDAEAQSVYYSSWMHSAIHIAVMIPELRTVAKLSHAFGLSESKVESVMAFLVEHGLVLQQGRHFVHGGAQTHLQNNSGNISKHHGNWRLQAMKSLDQPAAQDLHYSGVSVLSAADVRKIRELFTDVIENYVRAVEASAEEVVFAFNLDFFSVAGG